MTAKEKNMDLSTLQDSAPWEWPAETDLLILRTLEERNNDASDRLLAATLAAEPLIMSDKLARLLLAIVGNGEESEALRSQAALSLGPILEEADMEEFEDPERVGISETTFKLLKKTLHQYYRDAAIPEEVRQRVLEAAAHAPEDWQRDAIRAAFYRPSVSWQLLAVF
jgi:hypothetical protein